MLPLRQLIPPLTMRLPDGRIIRAWDFKQKKSLVVAFLDTDCDSCAEFLQRMAAQADEFRANSAVLLAAFLEAPPEKLTNRLPEGVFAGSDPSGHAARAFLGNDLLSPHGLANPAVFVADRYGELAAQWLVAQHAFPAVGEIFASVHQLEIACEECTSPLWQSEG
jgi:peroxiredoxin